MKLCITITLCALLFLAGPTFGHVLTLKHQCNGLNPKYCSKYEPICGDDGVTYSHMCNICYNRKNSGLNIQIAHFGECPRG